MQVGDIVKCVRVGRKTWRVAEDSDTDTYDGEVTRIEDYRDTPVMPGRAKLNSFVFVVVRVLDCVVDGSGLDAIGGQPAGVVREDGALRLARGDEEPTHMGVTYINQQWADGKVVAETVEVHVQDPDVQATLAIPLR